MNTWDYLQSKRREAEEIERLCTETIKGNKRAVIELYITAPFLFERGTRTYTVLEPYLYKANMVV